VTAQARRRRRVGVCRTRISFKCGIMMTQARLGPVPVSPTRRSPACQCQAEAAAQAGRVPGHRDRRRLGGHPRRLSPSRRREDPMITDPATHSVITESLSRARPGAGDTTCQCDSLGCSDHHGAAAPAARSPQ
jgi:hypothetical protein